MIGKNKNKEKKKVVVDKKKVQQELTTQEWVGIDDIKDGIVFLASGEILAGVEVQPISISLKDERELDNYMEGLSRSVETIRGDYQQVFTSKPVDIDNYLKKIKEKIYSATDPIRKELLKAKLVEATKVAISNDYSETKYYILMRENANSDKNVAKLKDRVLSLSLLLEKEEIRTTIMRDSDLESMYRYYNHKSNLKYVDQIDQMQGNITF